MTGRALGSKEAITGKLAGPALSQETIEAIEHAVKSLPTRQREIFVLKQYEHLHIAEIATIMNITTGGVKANYYKAIRALRRSLKAYAPEAAGLAQRSA